MRYVKRLGGDLSVWRSKSGIDRSTHPPSVDWLPALTWFLNTKCRTGNSTHLTLLPRTDVRVVSAKRSRICHAGESVAKGLPSGTRGEMTGIGND